MAGISKSNTDPIDGVGLIFDNRISLVSLEDVRENVLDFDLFRRGSGKGEELPELRSASFSLELVLGRSRDFESASEPPDKDALGEDNSGLLIKHSI